MTDPYKSVQRIVESVNNGLRSAQPEDQEKIHKMLRPKAFGETVPKASCKNQPCPNQFTPSRWGNQNAQNKGWFLQKNGDVWCPDHVPDWVVNWRKETKDREELKSIEISIWKVLDGIRDFPNHPICKAIEEESSNAVVIGYNFEKEQ